MELTHKWIVISIIIINVIGIFFRKSIDKAVMNEKGKTKLGRVGIIVDELNDHYQDKDILIRAQLFLTNIALLLSLLL